MKALVILKLFLNGYAPEDEDINEAIEEIKELENRSCINCNYSSVRFNIDCNLINKLDLPEKFCCNKWKNKA